MKRECETCIKKKTTFCPTSMECMATDDMPYYQNKIMLLEENQELKKKYVNAVADYETAMSENQQLKIQISAREKVCNRLEDNWNKLKEYISIKLYNIEYLQKLCGCRIDDIDHILLDAIRKEMQELEGSENRG